MSQIVSCHACSTGGILPTTPVATSSPSLPSRLRPTYIDIVLVRKVNPGGRGLQFHIPGTLQPATHSHQTRFRSGIFHLRRKPMEIRGTIESMNATINHACY